MRLAYIGLGVHICQTKKTGAEANLTHSFYLLTQTIELSHEIRMKPLIS